MVGGTSWVVGSVWCGLLATQNQLSAYQQRVAANPRPMLWRQIQQIFFCWSKQISFHTPNLNNNSTRRLLAAVGGGWVFNIKNLTILRFGKFAEFNTQRSKFFER